jgi:hypothetical protein
VAVDAAGNDYSAPYHSLAPREYLHIGDEIQARQVLPARRGRRAGLRTAQRVQRPPAVLVERATAHVNRVTPRYGFARDSEGCDYIVPRPGLTVHEEITGRVDWRGGGRLPALLPE